MQHGHYVHIRDPDYEQEREDISQGMGKEVTQRLDEAEETEGDAEELSPGETLPFEEPLPLKKGIIPLWRARFITEYRPDLLPPEPAPLQEEVRRCQRRI